MSIRRNFKFWNGITNFFGGVNFALGTHSMLGALSIDNSIATLSGSFILKDVIGQVGTLAFAYSDKLNSGDKNPLKLGTSISILLQSCYLLENLTPFFPQYFLILAGISNIGKNIGMVGLGSVNIKCIDEIKEKNEIAKSYAKITAQNSICSSVGMAAGVYITALIPDDCSRLLLVCPAVSFLQVWSYRKSVKSAFKKLN